MDSHSNCPVCDKVFNLKDIENHVNNCLFLNTRDEPATTPKRKRETSQSPQQSKQAKSSTRNANNSTNRTLVKVEKEPNETVETEKPKEKEFSFQIPLAETLRPTDLEDFVGQEQVIGDGALLRKLLDSGDIPSLILWGPPGCGKTTLANVIKETIIKKGKNKYGLSARFVKLHATTAGVADVKEVISIAKNERKMFHKRTILFMDEIHRFNKSQQDTFLPHIENGTITLIGATTQNPSFSLNNALLSRCRVITFEKLATEDIVDILHRAVDHVGGYVSSSSAKSSQEKFTIDEETIKWLADISDGDARIALNSLQMAIQSKPESNSVITLPDIKESIKRSHMLYDRNGDEHYNIISALHKSIRASHDTASLYWLTRMMEGGEDPIYIARRLVRAAAEDIGLADPNALVLAVSTLHGCQTIGMPESNVLLAQLAVYLARAPKSREVYFALKDAQKFIREYKGPQPSVPLDIRNAPTTFMKNLGYGQNYNTAHKDVSGLQYMPEGLENLSFFAEQS